MNFWAMVARGCALSGLDVVGRRPGGVVTSQGGIIYRPPSPRPRHNHTGGGSWRLDSPWFLVDLGCGCEGFSGPGGGGILRILRRFSGLAPMCGPSNHHHHR